MVSVRLEGLEELVERIVEEKLRARDGGFMDVEGAAAFLSLTPSAVRHKVERGQLPHHRAGGRVLFDRRELRAWVTSDPTPAD